MRRLLVLALFSGCVPGTPPPDPEVRIAVEVELGRPQPGASQGASVYAGALVYEMFLTPTPGGQWHSHVLKSWRFDPEGRLHLELREGLRFSDGSPVGAKDVIASFATAGLDAQPVEGGFVVTGGEAGVETAMLRAVLFKQSDAGALGTGPFRVDGFDDRSLRLTRIDPVPGRVNRVELVSFEDSRRAFAALLKGTVNVLTGPDPGVLELVDGVPGLEVVQGRGLHAISVLFNASIPAHERRALARSIDPVALAAAYGTNCRAVASVRPRSLPPEGRPLNIMTYDRDPACGRVALGLRRMLGPRGGDVQVLPLDRLFQKVRAGDYDLQVAPLQAWPEAIRPAIWHSRAAGNLTQYSNPALDEAFRRGDHASANALIEEDVPYVSICDRERVAIVDARLRNVKLGPYDLFESLPEWEVAR